MIEWARTKILAHIHLLTYNNEQYNIYIYIYNEKKEKIYFITTHTHTQTLWRHYKVNIQRHTTIYNIYIYICICLYI